MTRPTFAHDLEVRQQYLSMVYHAFPGQAFVLLNQGRAFSPSQTGDTSEYSRVGDKNKKTVAQTVKTDFNVQVYVEDDLTELARIMAGEVRPGGGWLGTEELQLDPTIVHNFKIVNFDGITTDSNILFTEYINSWQASGATIALESEGDVRFAELPGAASSYYIIPATGT